MSGANALYKQSDNLSKSTNSFLRSAPVELTTVAGYEEFIKRYSNSKYTTILKEDQSQGYILKDGEVLANIYGAAKDYLVEQSRCD